MQLQLTVVQQEEASAVSQGGMGRGDMYARL